MNGTAADEGVPGRLIRWALLVGGVLLVVLVAVVRFVVDDGGEA